MPDIPARPEPDAVALRTRAGDVARRIADGLAADVPDVDRSSWLSLANGHPGLALLFAELAYHDAGYADVANSYLDLARERLAASSNDGLFDGVAAVGFAARAVSRLPDEYGPLLTSFDQHVTARANGLVVAEHKRTTAGLPGVDPSTYGVTHGLAGLGAYLLTAHRHSLADVLTALVALTEPVTMAGRQLPGWWVSEAGGQTDGYLALGVADGIAGPLALLTHAWRYDVRVTDQERAIRRIAAWLAASARADGTGTYWPSTLTTTRERDAERPRDGGVAWCDGTPGIARALQLAGTALDVPAWRSLAVTALADTVDRALTEAGETGTSLCHGWAGALHVTWYVAKDTGDKRLLVRTHRLAERLLAELDADPLDDPGLLEGAAGVALALHTYASDTAPASGWDRALLVS